MVGSKLGIGNISLGVGRNNQKFQVHLSRQVKNKKVDKKIAILHSSSKSQSTEQLSSKQKSLTVFFAADCRNWIDSAQYMFDELKQRKFEYVFVRYLTKER